MLNITKNENSKKELDHKRSEWRRIHRTLNGRIILWPDKPPEHINARANRIYSWFWNKILLNLNQNDIPAIISSLREQINYEKDNGKIRMYRTMIEMAEDAFKLRNLDDILDYDTELMYDNKPIYNSEQGTIYRRGKIFTADYSDEETEIIVRDNEGIVIDRISYESKVENSNFEKYKNWDYKDK